MVSFRFHLLSLTAVFLALAVGIAIGATVVDQATVDVLQRRLNTVESNIKKTDKKDAQLSADVGEWRRFADQAGDELVEGRLTQVPVLVIGVRGMDRSSVDRFRQSLSRAGALLEGTVWFTSKLNLSKADDVAALGGILGEAHATPDELRRALVERLASSWAGSGEGNPLTALIEKSFVDFEPPDALPVTPDTLPRPETRFVVASDASANVPNELLGDAFAVQLAKSFPSRVLAVEPGGDDFVGALRANSQASTQLSTVDDLGDFRGRMAGVLALQDLGRSTVGHYGDQPRAQRLMPEPAS
jgi:hypothetical protein